MNLIEQKEMVRNQIAELTVKPSLTATERTKLNALMSQAADIRASEQREARLAAATKDTQKDLADSDEQRAANHEAAFKRYLKGANAEILRTYSPISTSGVPIPQGFLAQYVEKLKSFNGIRAVANVISTPTGQSLKNPCTDDTANIGERLNESDPVSLANPVFSSATFGAYRYSSKGVKYSAQLQQDAGIDVGEYLATIFARRIGTLQNSEYTLGGSGAMTGVIPFITNVLTTAGATSVTVGEIVDLQNIDEALLSGAVYMFNPATERALKKMTGTDGLPVFPEMRTARVLCGFPYVLNVSMADIAASAKAIAFGNFQHAVTVREVTPQLLVSRERFAEQNLLYSSLRADADCQVVDASALNILQQHA